MKNSVLHFLAAFMLAFLLLPAPAKAQYDHSVGIVVGTMEGFSYKGMIGYHCAFEADLAWRMNRTVGKATYSSGGVDVSVSDLNLWYWEFSLNPNIMYQGNVSSQPWGNLYWFAGGGLSIGFARPFADYLYWNKEMGKGGVNGLLGTEVVLKNAPVAVTFDFRPGYGICFRDGTSISVFDWALALTARYIF